MLLTLHERERLMIYTAAKLAAERRNRGLKLNLPEAKVVTQRRRRSRSPNPRFSCQGSRPVRSSSSG
jgi:urease gamma subunit-like protein